MKHRYQRRCAGRGSSGLLDRPHSGSAPANPMLFETPAPAGAFVRLGRLLRSRLPALGAALLVACAAVAQTPQATQPAQTTPSVQAPVAQSAQVVRSANAVHSPQSAATPQFALGTSAVDSVPQTTVVPVLQPAVQVVEHTTVYEDPTRDMTRPERRAYKARLYAQKIDSLVQSRNYMFFPNSMQELPGGLIRSIYADYFFFGMFVDHVEVHLPTERGVTQYVEMLNFDSMSIRNYQAAHLQWGWCVSFEIADGDAVYHTDFAVSTSTGQTVLTLITPSLTMRYVGWLWNKRIDDPRYRRLD